MANATKPYSVAIDLGSGALKSFNKKVEVKLRDLRGFFYDRGAVDAAVYGLKNPTVYEYFENSQPSARGQMNFGVTTLNPGKVGSEYYMTRGHYHAKKRAAEIYVGLGGKGIVVMQTKEGRFFHSPISRGRIVYIPPLWAHRTVNTGEEKLSFFYAYASDAGHDYGTIRRKGFAKLVVEKGGRPKIIDNPKYSP
ncbi:MAG: glucose-6-phosphate isomerase [Candidatus Brockarchaeota archaeon]|nr:glucose-6-phosphate isomerase [Candidatus Brockarchaeota archaeon]